MTCGLFSIWTGVGWRKGRNPSGINIMLMSCEHEKEPFLSEEKACCDIEKLT